MTCRHAVLWNVQLLSMEVCNKQMRMPLAGEAKFPLEDSERSGGRKLAGFFPTRGRPFTPPLV